MELRFFYHLRTFSISFGLMFLIPMFAYWFAYVIVGKREYIEVYHHPQVQLMHKEVNDIDDQLKRLRSAEKELSTKELAPNLRKQIDNLHEGLSELEKQLDRLSSAKELLAKESDPNLKEELDRLRSEITATEDKRNDVLKKIDNLRDELREKDKLQAEYYQRWFFLILAGIGLLAFIVGYFIPLASLSTGSIVGGMFCFAYGYYSYWGYLHAMVKLISLTIAILLLFVMAYMFAKRGK